MTLEADELLRLLKEGEGSRLEFKRGLPRASKVARTLAAFANTRGGYLLVGVDDHGRVEGAPRPRETAEELRAIAREAIEPPLTPRIQTLRIDGVPVVAAAVGLSPARPHGVLRDGGQREYPIRVGASTRAARGPALAALRLAGTSNSKSGLTPLERQVLAWTARERAGEATPQAFAKTQNIGLARARRAFIKLERAGRILGHGERSRRTYGLP
jgi:predicted HTH transcriptional regulator